MREDHRLLFFWEERVMNLTGRGKGEGHDIFGKKIKIPKPSSSPIRNGPSLACVNIFFKEALEKDI